MTHIPNPITVNQGGTGAGDAAGARTNLGAVPNTRKVNGKSLNADVNVLAADITDFTSAVNALLAAGHQAASGTITRLSSDASGSQSISLAFQPTLVLFSFLDSADATANSDGWDDGSIATCSSIFSTNFLTTLIGALGLASLSTKSQALSIWIQTSSGNGHQAKISAKSGTGFTLAWTKLGSGRNISGRYFAFY